MTKFDKGPTQKVAKLFARVPDYLPYKDSFWFDWDPVFYRGRLDGSARLLCVASDPGPTERLVSRSLVGDAGQRVQGFFTKLGLTHSYLCLNAFIYALHPSHFYSGKKILEDPQHTMWRNKVFNTLTSSNLQAIVAFGSMAQIAVNLWEDKGDVPVFNVCHPSFREQEKLLLSWKEAILKLRSIVTPDQGDNIVVPNYGNEFKEEDYSAIPKEDLPFGLPHWMGNDAWGRTSSPRHNNCVRRPKPDDGHTLIWIAPAS
jgi:uracil-DNA glycosylase